MKKMIIGLVICVFSIAAYGQDGRHWEKECGFDTQAPIPADEKVVILKDIDKYKVKYVITESCYNWWFETYKAEVAIYEEGRLIQYCDGSYTCGLMFNGINCPDNTEEWMKEVDYIDFDCVVLGNVDIGDITVHKEHTPVYPDGAHWRR
jgi:hypothetical protein